MGLNVAMGQINSAAFLGETLSIFARQQVVDYHSRLSRLIEELSTLSADEQRLASDLRTRLDARLAWVEDLLTRIGASPSIRVTPPHVSAPSWQEASANEASPLAPSLVENAVHFDGAQILSGAGVVLLAAATLIFERGQSRWMLVAPSLALMLLLTALAAWCYRAEKLQPAAVIFRWVTALTLPLLIINLIQAMHWESAPTQRDVTVATGAAICAVVYGTLATKIRSRGFLALAHLAVAAAWLALTALLPVVAWRPVSLALLGLGYLAATRLPDWRGRAETGSVDSLRPSDDAWMGVSANGAVSLVFHFGALAAAVIAMRHWFPLNPTEQLSHVNVMAATFALITLGYLLYLRRSPRTWPVVMGLVALVATSLTASILWASANVPHMVALLATALSVYVYARLIDHWRGGLFRRAYFQVIVLLAVFLSSISWHQPSWLVTLFLFAATALAAAATTYRRDVATELTTVGGVLAELVGALALYHLVWDLLITLHRDHSYSTPGTEMVAAGVVSLGILVRAYWVKSFTTLLKVSSAYLPAVLALLVTVTASLHWYKHGASPLGRAGLVAVITLVYALLVLLVARRLQRVWLAFASGLLLVIGINTVVSGYDVQHAALLWLPPLTVFGVIFAPLVIYVARRLHRSWPVIVSAALMTLAAAEVLRAEVVLAWMPLAIFAGLGLVTAAARLSETESSGGQWLPQWLDGDARFRFDTWRHSCAASRRLLLLAGVLWSGVFLHHDGRQGGLVALLFIAASVVPTLRRARSSWILRDQILVPLTLSGVVPVIAVMLRSHNLQFFNLVPASTLLYLSVTIIDRVEETQRAVATWWLRASSVLALAILFGTTLAQAFGSGVVLRGYLSWLMVEAVLVLLLGVRTRTRVSSLVGSLGVLSSIGFTLSHGGGVLGYLTAVTLAIVLLFVALRQIAKRSDVSLGERTKKAWASWR